VTLLDQILLQLPIYSMSYGSSCGPWINYLFIMIFGLTNKPHATTV
jgi:hypothetical protein